MAFSTECEYSSQLYRLEEAIECFCQDSQDAVDQPEILTSCALTETTQDLLSELHQTFCSLEELGSAGPSGPSTERGSTLEGELDSGGSGRNIRPFSLQDSSLLLPRRRSVRSRQLQVPGVPLSRRNDSSRNPPAQHLLSPRDRLPGGEKALHKEEAACFRCTPENRLGHCKLGSWWKQALETQGAFSGLLPAIEQVSTISKKRGSLSFLGDPTPTVWSASRSLHPSREETSRRSNMYVEVISMWSLRFTWRVSVWREICSGWPMEGVVVQAWRFLFCL
nr:uncharacterized protein LOC115138804 [Oncorhynchus nerka]